MIEFVRALIDPDKVGRGNPVEEEGEGRLGREIGVDGIGWKGGILQGKKENSVERKDGEVKRKHGY